MALQFFVISSEWLRSYLGGEIAAAVCWSIEGRGPHPFFSALWTARMVPLTTSSFSKSGRRGEKRAWIEKTHQPHQIEMEQWTL